MLASLSTATHQNCQTVCTHAQTKHTAAHLVTPCDEGEQVGIDQSSAPSTKRKKINARVLKRVDRCTRRFAGLSDRKEGLSRSSASTGQTHKRFNVLDTAGKPASTSLRRAKVSVMIVGNHSSGKSSFINWYINEKLLGTSMAIEQGLILHLRQGEGCLGEEDARKFPEIADIATTLKDPSVVNCLETHFSQSDERLFSMVNFIDTPGLVDGARSTLPCQQGHGHGQLRG